MTPYIDMLSEVYSAMIKALYRSGEMNDWIMPYFKVYEDCELNPIASMALRDDKYIIRIIVTEDHAELYSYDSKFFNEVPMRTVYLPKIGYSVDDLEELLHITIQIKN